MHARFGWTNRSQCFPCKEYIYRPQTKFAKVMFLHLSVILFTWGGLPGEGCPGPGLEGVCPGVVEAQAWGVSRPRPRGCPGPGLGHPGPVPGGGQAQRDVCVSQHALRQKLPPPPADDYCCGRYASYWNACLLLE